MKLTFRSCMLAGAAVTLSLLTPVSPREAEAASRYRAVNGGYYYGGGYARSYRGYSGYGYSQFGNGGYTYFAPRAYAYPAYEPYQFGSGFRHGATYDGRFDRFYGGARAYGRSYRPVYTPYGFGGYGGFDGFGF